MALEYTTIQHAFRKVNKLSCNEYVLADMIYCLSVDNSAKIKGWCYMSRIQMGIELGVTKQSILNILDSLILKGFIEKNNDTSYLRTLKKWNNVYEKHGKESLPETPIIEAEKPEISSKESLPLVKKVYRKKVVKTGKKSLPTVKNLYPDGKESLPEIGKESLPNTNKEISILDNKEKKEAGLFDDLKIEDSNKEKSELDIALENFCEMRKKKKAPLIEAAKLMMRKKALLLAMNDESIAAKILDQSTLGTWTDIYKLKKDNHNQNNQNEISKNIHKTGSRTTGGF